MNVKGIEVTLVNQAKADALAKGQTLTQWIREAMEWRLGIGAEEVMPVAEAIETVAVTRGTETSVKPSIEDLRRMVEKIKPAAMGIEEEEETKAPECPDDGDQMVWNRVLKRWVCKCGYQGKVQR